MKTFLLQDIELDLPQVTSTYTIQDALEKYSKLRKDLIKHIEISETQRRIQNKLLHIPHTIIYTFWRESEEDTNEPEIYINKSESSESEEITLSSDYMEEEPNQFVEFEAELSGTDEEEAEEDIETIKKEIKESKFITKKEVDIDCFENLRLMNELSESKDKAIDKLIRKYRSKKYQKNDESEEEESSIEFDNILDISSDEKLYSEVISEKPKIKTVCKVGPEKVVNEGIEFMGEVKEIGKKLVKKNKSGFGFTRVEK
ncbi:hypothetical protein TCON_0979 [Astathelohania contejeani]|uniref:Uncharacterized protein n=1 Tax=Astathelohania contejeani TaxID=164912 RepID=A0ABQ7I038_9MICR|nr:hypothetical protein TCON_0979 [Thelohania contejeani]